MYNDATWKEITVVEDGKPKRLLVFARERVATEPSGKTEERKRYQLQTTVTTTTLETVTADSEEEAIATGGTTGSNMNRQVSVQKTAVLIAAE